MKLALDRTGKLAPARGRYYLPRASLPWENNVNGAVEKISRATHSLRVFYSFGRPEYYELEKVLNQDLDINIENEKG
ncbi:MAG: hypothetical protein HRT47_10570 [Candidatus Caenarcaniphilales bacterium]|nr:hypothetical protein [Candidatus Caenarcaniphilales bacterium]